MIPNNIPAKGDVVLYTCEFDTNKRETPNIIPAMVTGVSPDLTLDLFVFFMNGNFYKLNVPLGLPGERETWHPR